MILRPHAMVMFFVLSLAAACFAGTVVNAEEDTTVYELRTYTCHPGKLPDLHARFKNHTMKLFEKHGMKNVMYWTPLDKEDTLVYVIAHKSREAADESWKGFVNDPEWKKVAKESEVNGKIVMKVERQYLKTTDYSPKPE